VPADVSVLEHEELPARLRLHEAITVVKWPAINDETRRFQVALDGHGFGSQRSSHTATIF
jgi:hypothetical protein